MKTANQLRRGTAFQQKAANKLELDAIAVADLGGQPQDSLNED